MLWRVIGNNQSLLFIKKKRSKLYSYRLIFLSRELVARLESDLEVIDSGKQKEEFRKLQDEVEKLKGELEHRALKGDFNCNSRILHFRMNPQAVAEQEAEEKQKALLRELEELRARNSTGSGGGGTVGTSSLHAQGQFN